MYTLGGLVGALSAGPVASKYGRLRTMQLTTIFFTIGPVFEALSPGIAVMAFGRLLSGIGAGAAVVIVPLYISEISPPAQRGFFGAFTQIMCNVGIFVTQLLGYFLSHDSYWRFILAVGGLLGIAQALGLLLSVESPKYLAEQGNLTLAKRTLRKIRGEGADIDSEMSDWNTAGAEAGNGRSDPFVLYCMLTGEQKRSKRFCTTRTAHHRTLPNSPGAKRSSASCKSSVIRSTRAPQLPLSWSC
jgi:MFS family permease